MEKYSVDKENDKIERRAQDLVKTGNVKLSTARRIAAEEDESGAHKQFRSGKDIRKKS